jgi:hypothetical protein
MSKPFNISLIAAAALSAVGGLVYYFRPATPRSKVVKAATSQIGKQDSSVYWKDVLPSQSSFPPEWCGAFALWSLHQAGLAKAWNWEIGKGFLYKLPTTKDPQPGDIAYFSKFQHQAVVKSVEGDNVTLLNGNGTGKAVTETTIPKAHAAAYYSIAPLLVS